MSRTTTATAWRTIDRQTDGMIRTVLVMACELLEHAEREGIRGILTDANDGESYRIPTAVIVNELRQIVYRLGGPDPTQFDDRPSVVAAELDP